MAALCMLPFCSWVLLPEKNNQSSGGMDSYGILWHDRYGNLQTRAHASPLTPHAAELRPQPHPSELCSSARAGTSFWVSLGIVREHAVAARMLGSPGKDAWVFCLEAGKCLLRYRYAPKEDLCCRAGRNGGLERHK